MYTRACELAVVRLCKRANYLRDLTHRVKRRLRDRKKNMDEWNRDHWPFCAQPLTYAHNELLHKIRNRERIRVCLPCTFGSVAVSTITITITTTIFAAAAIKATARTEGRELWERADVRRFRFYPRKSLKFLPSSLLPSPNSEKSILFPTFLFMKRTNSDLFKNV